ncbi:two-pore potassium channel 5-like [Amaranthus tricolor]|uniref:two-pore potassium channel 5-like n=1 Tax=Amaranthus tricolor TaxID=29722 RepID=UPI002589BAF3|nr:two-pore potassium channel 5-like [Amaranthus tricolor]
MDVNGKTEDGEFQPLLYTNYDEIGSSHTKMEVNLRTQSLSSGIPHIGSSDSEQLPRTKSLQRSKTAPAKDMAAVLREIQANFKAQVQSEAEPDTETEPQDPTSSEEEDDEELKSSSKKEMAKQAGILLVIYLVMGVLVYGLNQEQFAKGVETHPVVDALYFCIVTMCTIGYGDITPLSPFTKIFACLFVLIGFGFIDILLTGVVNYVLDLQEQNILSDILHHQTTTTTTFANNVNSASNNNHNHNHNRQNHLLHFLTLRIVDVQKGRMRIRLKVGLALFVLVLCIGVGTIFLYFVEEFTWVDALYLSALSVTTVGYGDRAFNTLTGRIFASVWLLVSTLAVARAFLYLVEARIHKRQRTIAKWVLQRDITPLDLFAANINNNDFINKSEYVIFKLKEMGKIGEQDISQICHQFDKLDTNNMGRITLPDLLQNRSLSLKVEDLP